MSQPASTSGNPRKWKPYTIPVLRRLQSNQPSGVGKLEQAEVVGQTSACPGNQRPALVGKVGNNGKQDGLYIRAQMYNQNINCLVDTGSTITVLHPTKYLSIPETVRPALNSGNVQLRMADGGVVSSLGSTVLTFHINGKMLRQRMVIAEVEAPIVLGYDFLYEYDCQINISGGTLTIEGETMQCVREI
jgi:hypothetical protein